MKEPQIVDKLLSETDFSILKKYLYEKEKKESDYYETFGRYTFSDKIINDYAEKLVPKAREVFGSNTLLHSYSLFSHYEGKQASLYSHKDDNACTYTLDLCIYQNEPWDIIVEGKPYVLQENQALAFFGNDQEHSRPEFPNPESQHVCRSHP